MLRDDRILDLAEIHCDLDTDSRGRKSFEFDDHGIVAFARAVERSAYEAAIKACDKIAGNHRQFSEERRKGAGMCSAEITALMTQEQPK